jgi:hypothetical protein
VPRVGRLCQVLHVQQPKEGTIVDRNAVDLAVSDAFRRFKVVAFYFDPSHVKDDDAEGDEPVLVAAVRRVDGPVR